MQKQISARLLLLFHNGRWIRSGRLRARKVGTQHVVSEEDLRSLFKGDVLPLPPDWKKTSTGEPMPNVVHSVRRSRAGR